MAYTGSMSGHVPDSALSMKRWVETWQTASRELEQIRADDIRAANTQQAIRLFDLAFKAALRNTPPREHSGLVEFQRLLQKMRR